MGTNTIQGYEADPVEVDALAAAALAEIMEGIEDIVDPLARYTALCAEQVRQVAVRRVVESAIVRERGVELRRIADDMARDGQGDNVYDRIAHTTGLGTKARVSQIIAPKGANPCVDGVSPGR